MLKGGLSRAGFELQFGGVTGTAGPSTAGPRRSGRTWPPEQVNVETASSIADSLSQESPEPLKSHIHLDTNLLSVNFGDLEHPLGSR